MKPVQKLAAIGLLVFLGGCGESGAIKKAVTESLIDPDSVKFGELLISRDGKEACINVNAKNRLGGYTGEQGAYLSKVDGEWLAYSSGDIECNKENLERLATV